MNDPRLNSVHLPGPRRDVFRHARHALIAACGEQTLCGETPVAAEKDSRTIIRQESPPSPEQLQFWLADGEYIYPLKVGLNTIGRSPENDVVVPDPFISRRQCAILVHHNSRCELHDTASKNGTLLNGEKLSGPSKLRPGDRITLNDRQFVFMSQNGGQPEPESDGTLAG